LIWSTAAMRVSGRWGLRPWNRHPAVGRRRAFRRKRSARNGVRNSRYAYVQSRSASTALRLRFDTRLRRGQRSRCRRCGRTARTGAGECMRGKHWRPAGAADESRSPRRKPAQHGRRHERSRQRAPRRTIACSPLHKRGRRLGRGFWMARQAGGPARRRGLLQQFCSSVSYGPLGGFLPPLATKLTQSPWFLNTP
jgi:hypothetical protein